MRKLEVVVTNDEAELEVFSRANEKGKFAVPIGGYLPPAIQFALERGFDNDWWRLIDVDTISAAPGAYHRIFKITDKGFYRMAVLKGTQT